MEPERGGSRGGTGFVVLGVGWFFGTMILGYLALYNGFALAGAPSRNAELAQVLIYAALALGGGAPLVGLFASMLLNNKGGMVLYGLIVLALAALVLALTSQGRSDHVYKEDPAVCTAPPDEAAGVPGC
ncbi:hypothetical protein [Nonomuraea sp. NPDC049725]|uniref:hypothetical protein n=1 Tax=Nonomuraea sp. NPDC049725 TaxID=3154508 RepID=UPI0034120330